MRYDPDADTTELTPMPGYWTQEAARKLSERSRTAGYGDFNPDQWFPWILQVLAQLMACQPDPQEAYEYLTWRPYWFMPFSAYRLRQHRQAIRDALAKSPRANAAELARPSGATDPLAALFECVDAGDLTRPMLANLYRERANAG